METSVLISGGGIAGITLALRLVEQGVDVIILEKHLQDSVLYKGELLQPKSIRILDQLGVLPEILQRSWKIPRTLITERDHAARWERTYTFDYGVLPSPYSYALMIPHDTLKGLLLEKAKRSGLLRVLKPAQIERFAADPHEVLVHVDGQETVIRAKYLIGAEGKFSAFRSHLRVHVKKQEYNHQFLTVTIDRPDDLIDATVISQGSRFIGLFPLPEGQVRTVLLLRGGQFRELKRAGIEAFHRAYHELVPALKGYVDRLNNWKEIQLMIPLRQEARQYVIGNRAMIGDAVHSVHPMAGEGMNMAIQDADVLGSLLGWMIREGHEDNHLLREYERIRKPRAQFVSALSHLSALAYSYPFAVAQAMRSHILGRISASPYLTKQYMVNISGLGMSKETLFDRALQVGIWPKKWFFDNMQSGIHWFSDQTDYPWLHR